MTERKLRKLANELGYSIKKGYQCFFNGGRSFPFYDENGDKIPGYVIINYYYNAYVGGVDGSFGYTFDLDDVFEFFGETRS